MTQLGTRRPRGRTPPNDGAPSRRRFTVDEYDQMIAHGIIREGKRVELIEGEIVEMAAMGSLHAACVDRANEWFTPRVVGRARPHSVAGTVASRCRA